MGKLKRKTKERCEWAGLSNWMEEHNMGVMDIADALGKVDRTVYMWLDGTTEPRKSHIDELLKLTGLSYEELFAEKKRRILADTPNSGFIITLCRTTQTETETEETMMIAKTLTFAKRQRLLA